MDDPTDNTDAAFLNNWNIDPIIPGGFPKFILAPDFFWNKPFKVMCIERYDQWLVEEGIHKNPQKTMRRHRLENKLLNGSWNRSLKSCARNVNVDDSADGVIHCFKESQALAVWRYDSCTNPKSANEGFEELHDWKKVSLISITNSDEEEAANQIFILGKDKGDGKLVDMEGIWEKTFWNNLSCF